MSAHAPTDGVSEGLAGAGAGVLVLSPWVLFFLEGLGA